MGFRILRSTTWWMASFCLWSSAALATVHPYYGEKLAQNSELHLNSATWRENLFEALSLWHLPRPNRPDEILSTCNAPECYRHSSLTYTESRSVMFGEIHLFEEKGNWGVEDVYCEVIRWSDEFGSTPPGPRRIPNPQVMNAEHTWPQSLFSKNYDRDMQKSDLHGLYPVFSRVNSSRSNNAFGWVREVTSQICPASKKGVSIHSDRIVFEPPHSHKGNVARALFYFSVRYEMPIDPEQERDLREWHALDPVDPREQERNQIIFEQQKTRNPFIDHPDWVQNIHDF